MTQFFNQPEQRNKRRDLRSTMPSAEVILWSKLKGRQLLGCKFRRQYGIGAYVVDFYCFETKLAFELDGESHFRTGSQKSDWEREEFIRGFGIKTLRFLNADVYENLDGVWEVIAREVRLRFPEGVVPGRRRRWE